MSKIIIVIKEYRVPNVLIGLSECFEVGALVGETLVNGIKEEVPLFSKFGPNQVTHHCYVFIVAQQGNEFSYLSLKV